MTPKSRTTPADEIGNVKTSPSLPPQPASPVRRTPQRLTPIEVFKLCIRRAENLVKIHKTAVGKRKGKPEEHLADAYRAAITLAISALDAYVRTLVLSKVRELLDSSKPIPGALVDRLRNLMPHEQLLEAARQHDFLERVDKGLQAEFDTESFQGRRKIEAALSLIGHKDIMEKVAQAARQNAVVLTRELEHFTQRRHSIAHRGDYDLTCHPPMENSITKQDAQKCIKLVVLIAEHVEKVVQ